MDSRQDLESSKTIGSFEIPRCPRECLISNNSVKRFESFEGIRSNDNEGEKSTWFRRDSLKRSAKGSGGNLGGWEETERLWYWSVAGKHSLSTTDFFPRDGTRKTRKRPDNVARFLHACFTKNPPKKKRVANLLRGAALSALRKILL